MDKYKIKKQIKGYKQQLASAPQEIYMTLEDVIDMLQDIVDDYDKEPKKYRVRINDPELPTPLYLCDVTGDERWPMDDGLFLAYRVTKDKQYAATFTKEFIMDNFKNYLAIDWSKALEPAEDKSDD